MHKFRPFHQLMASLTAVSLVFATVAPSAFAQEAAAPAEAAEAPAEAAAEAEASEAPAEGEAAEGGAAEGEAAEGEGEAEPEKRGPPTDEEREAARAAFEGGMAAMEEERYLDAAVEFKKANEAIPSPHAEYWIALALDKADPNQENPKPTAEAYELFVTNPAAKHVGEDKLAESVERVKELRKLLPAELVVITNPAGATVTLGEETVEGVTPVTVERPAGAYTLTASLEGYQPLTIEVNLEGGIILEQEMNLVELPPPPPPVVAAPVEEEKEKSMVPAYVTLGLAGAGLITGTVFGILALDSKSKYDENPTAELADETERNALIADMSFGVAITLGITGVVLLTAKDDDETGKAKKKSRYAGVNKHPKQGQLVVSPYGGPTGGGGVARLTF